jgi:hypothetical protein
MAGGAEAGDGVMKRKNKDGSGKDEPRQFLTGNCRGSFGEIVDKLAGTIK